ncbi:hypothetical protein DIPPA_31108, partial [Diplonema papillatum]
IGAPRVLIEPTRTFRSAGNGDGSCRSWHRRHNVDSIVQRVFPLWLAASLRIPGGAGTSTPQWKPGSQFFSGNECHHGGDQGADARKHVEARGATSQADVVP